MSVNGKAPGFGEHALHHVHPHNHAGQDHDHRLDRDWCSGKYLCATCSGDDLPRGTWFEGPRCPRPAKVAAS